VCTHQSPRSAFHTGPNDAYSLVGESTSYLAVNMTTLDELGPCSAVPLWMLAQMAVHWWCRVLRVASLLPL